MAEESKKVLIIVYYWPPSGGSGVQRWIKLSKYLVGLGVEVFVLTVDEKAASYMQTDESLVREIHPDIRVFKTTSFEIINIFARIFGKKKVPTAGFYNLDKKSLIHNISLLIRSNLFIPDPRRGWNNYAYREAAKIIRREGITKIITSSPPHSSQLIGLKLKKRLGVEWTADLRDPWTDIFYYKLLKHSIISKRIDRRYERSVLVNADRIITVSKKLKEILIKKDSRINPGKISVIPNGFDEEDFDGISGYSPGREFVIGYTGTMSAQYDPKGFLEAFSEFNRQTGGQNRLEITGTISPEIVEFIDKLGIKDFVSLNDAVPHDRIPGLLAEKSALLLTIPRVENAELILTGKLFEYLASGRPIILAGPPEGDAAGILRECEAGEAFHWDSKEGMVQYLLHLKTSEQQEIHVKDRNRNVMRYSRKEQAEMIKQLIFH